MRDQGDVIYTGIHTAAICDHFMPFNDMKATVSNQILIRNFDIAGLAEVILQH